MYGKLGKILKCLKYKYLYNWKIKQNWIHLLQLLLVVSSLFL